MDIRGLVACGVALIILFTMFILDPSRLSRGGKSAAIDHYIICPSWCLYHVGVDGPFERMTRMQAFHKCASMCSKFKTEPYLFRGPLRF